MMGNFRFDAITFGSADSGDGVEDVGVVVLRGQYDHQQGPVAVASLIDAIERGVWWAAGRDTNQPPMPPQTVDGILCFHPEIGIGTALFPDDQRLVLVIGPSKLDAVAVKDMTAALTSGAGKIGADQAMARLLKNVDTTKPLWAATRFSADDRKDEPPRSQQTRDTAKVRTGDVGDETGFWIRPIA